MTISSNLVLWTILTLLNVAGVLAAAHAWNTRFAKNYARLVWLLPAVLVAAWLASFFGTAAIERALSGLAVLFSLRSFATNAFAFLLLGLVFLAISRATRKRSAPRGAVAIPQSGDAASDTTLRETVESFLAAADSGNVDRLAATYAPDFLCIRVADAGGFAQITADQMLSFLRRAFSGQAVGHTVPAKNTIIHHAEVLGDSAVVLVTRMKDLGNGWEPLFYSLLWRKQGSNWRLLRECVHQRSVPNWSGLPGKLNS